MYRRVGPPGWIRETLADEMARRRFHIPELFDETAIEFRRISGVAFRGHAGM